MLSLLKNGGFSRASGTIPDQQGQVAIAHLKRLSASGGNVGLKHLDYHLNEMIDWALVRYSYLELNIF